MDFLGSGNDTGKISSHNYNFSSNISSLNDTQASKMRSPCDGRFSWTAHGPLIMFCVLIIAFNSVVIALMRWKETLRTSSNIILVSLAVSDLMFGLFGIPLFFSCSITVTYTSPGSPTACVCSVLFMQFTAVSTVLHFLLVACDRYIRINVSMLYSTLVTWPRVKCALIAIWLISPAVVTVQLAWYKAKNYRETKDKHTVFFLVLVVAFFAVPLLFMLCIYGHIIVVSIHHLRAMRALRKNLGTTIKTRSIARDMRGTVILISMLAVFSGCWFPFFLMMLQSYTSVHLIPTSSWVLCYTFFARFIPPLTNPMFCAFCKRNFRNALRVWVKSRAAGFTELFDSICHKRNRSSEEIRVSFCQSVDCVADDYERNFSESSFGLYLLFQERREFQTTTLTPDIKF